MPLLNLLSRPFSDHKETEIWTFSHMQDHLEIINAIKKQKSVTLVPWLVWPFNPDDASSWLDRHQQLHDDMNNILKLDGINLQDLDFNKKDIVANWTDINYREHYNARIALKI